MAAIERALVIAALQHDAWEAASLLGITDKRLERLMKKHKIVWPPKRKRSTPGKAKPAAKAGKALSRGTKARPKVSGKK